MFMGLNTMDAAGGTCANDANADVDDEEEDAEEEDITAGATSTGAGAAMGAVGTLGAGAAGAAIEGVGTLGAGAVNIEGFTAGSTLTHAPSTHKLASMSMVGEGGEEGEK
jgi:hypothetical protein